MNEKPKRVLQIIPSTGIGGIESVVMNLYRNMDKQKLQFDFVAFNRGSSHDEIIEMGGRITYFPYMKTGIISYVRALKKLIQEQGPYHAVHIHDGYKGGFSLIAARLAGIDNRVIHIHATDAEIPWQRAVIPLLKSLAVRNATEYLACGQDAGRFMYGERPFQVLSNAIQTSDFTSCTMEDRERIRQELNISDDCIVVGHVARMVPSKNHQFTIELAEQLKKKYPSINLRFVLPGAGPLQPELEQKIHEKGLDSYFNFVGLRDDMPALMHAFDILLVPSFIEGLPVIMLEAQTSGLPCLVSTNVSRESDIEAGLVTFKELSEGPEAWASTLLECVNKGRGSKQHSITKLMEHGFDIEGNIQKLMKLYKISS